MAVLGRILFGSGERIDLPDLLSIDSYTAADFKYLIQTFIGGDTPYVLKGFDVIQPQDSIGTENVSIRVADSIVYYPGSNAGSFYYGLPEGNTNSQPVVPELRKNATNFVYLTFNTFDTAKDARAFWDPDQNGGNGGEFSQDINTESVLSIEVNVSVSTFPDNTIPICKVTVGSSVIESIQDCRDMMFRLGKGGVTPNPFADYSFRNDPSSTYARSEPSTTMTSSLDPNPFQGGDKNIYTLKEWMDVVMTKLKELGGTTYWYEGSSGGPAPTPGNNNIFLDALASTLKSKGEWQHSGTTAGEATWTEDIHYLSLRDPRDLIFRASTINLSNDEVAWIELIRDVEINGSSQAVSWLNGSNIVNGVTGAFVNLSKGDWTKKKTDAGDAFARVDEFYALPNLAGGTTTPALAQSIRLSNNYAGTTGSEIGEYTKGEYLSTDVNITTRDDASVQAAGGNLFWLAYRSDTILSLASIIPTQLTINITEADGEVARVTSTVAHGLLDGDRVTITTGPYTGTYQVDVADTTNFYIQTAVTGDSLAQTAFYAVVTTAARNTAYAFNLETATHGYESNQRITIQNTSSAYDGSYLINVRSTTSLQIPISSLISNPGSISGEIVVLPRMNVRTEFGTVKVVQGESIDIGDADSKNILSFIGMESLAQTKPTYHLPSGYNALRGHANYNSDSDDNLTVRAARLTAMMADRVQDRGVILYGRTNIKNVTNGANQEISALGNLTLVKPSSPDQTVTLTSVLSLPTNSAIVIDLDRDGSAAIIPTVVSLGSQLLLQENRMLLFYRFSGTTVYDWNGNIISASGHINTGAPEDSQNRNISVFNPGRAVLDSTSGLVTLDLTSLPEITSIVTVAAASIPQSSYFTFAAANDVVLYYVWFNVNGGGTNPSIVGRTGIQVNVSTGDSATTVAAATVLAINTIAGLHVTASNTFNLITLTNDAVGYATDADDGLVPTGFSITVDQHGVDPDIEIIIPGAPANNIIDVSAINGLGTLIVPDLSSVWVRVNRFAAKTFNTVATVDLPDTDVAGKLYITLTSAVPIDQDVMVLWTRLGSSLVSTHQSLNPQGNIYEEFYTVVAPITSGTDITLPVDSRDSGNAQKYVVGSGQLEVYLNGQFLRTGIDWAEIGSAGNLSDKIQILQNLVVNDVLYFRIDAQGAVFFAVESGGGGGGGGTLQDAYDAGRFINITTGLPVVITGASGKLMSIQGDIEVTGVVDPTAIQFTPQISNPLPLDQAGFWVDINGDVMYQKGDMSSPDNFSSVIDGNVSSSSIEIELANNSGSTIAAFTPVLINSSGDMAPINVSMESSIAAVGLTTGSVAHGATGSVIVNGRILNVTTSAAFGDVLYISKTGGLTNTKPSIGVDGFAPLDFAIRVGVVGKNASNPANKDVIISVYVVGQL